MIDYKLEDIPFEDVGNYKILNLPPLTKDEINIIDPIVAPTSGLRIQILETHAQGGWKSSFRPKRHLYLC
jgi:hypothetical protein